MLGQETKGPIVAIGRAVRPSVLVFGVVSRVTPRRKKADNVIYGHDVVLSQESGAQIAVMVYQREDEFGPVLPLIDSNWAAECTVEESRDYGATLIYERPADSMLDLLVKA